MSPSKRPRASLSGYLIREFVLPVLYGRRGASLARYHLDIARNRAAGPALPPKRIVDAYRFTDTTPAAGRQFRLARKIDAPLPSRILYLHGGAYVFDFLGSQWAIMTGLAERLSAEIVAPLYPLAPENNVNAGLACVRATYLALVAEVGADKVAIIGDSAGGGLALALAQTLSADGAPAPAALVLLFPWLDATVTGADQPALQKLDALLSIEHLRDAGQMWAGSSDPALAPASPLYGDLTRLPPTLVQVGSHDLLVSDARRLAKAAPDISLHEYAGMFHGFVCAPIPEARRAFDEAAAFIRVQMDATR